MQIIQGAGYFFKAAFQIAFYRVRYLCCFYYFLELIEI